MTQIAVNGAMGRMGQRILALARQASKDFKVMGEYDVASIPLSAGLLKGKGVLIDFSGPTGTPTALVQAQKAGWGLVIGTTGLDEKIQDVIRATSKKIPIVYTANMSVGVNLVAELLELAALKLGPEFKIRMSETHHVHKKDAPSGTALMLKKAMAVSKQDIAIESIREGEVVGDHTVLFSGPAETIEVTHRAQSRDVFALGALKAALFLSKKGKPGKPYSMRDVLRA